MFITPAYAQAAGTASAGLDLMSFLPLILIFVVFYFLLIRPQQQKMKQHKAMISAVRRGDQVVTAGGILGKVTKIINDSEAQVEIAEGVRVRILKSTLSDIVSKTAPAAVSKSESQDDEADDETGKDESSTPRESSARGS
jgi:preprotein translocase subunit YajC